MRRPRRITTLFPYTTLFRSRLLAGLRHTESGVGCRYYFYGHARRPPRLGAYHCAGGAALRAGNAGQDRKSTRLNSSHVKISYAVFCLKKKNITAAPPFLLLT